MVEKVKIEIQLTNNGKFPKKAHENDACFDLWTSRNQETDTGSWSVNCGDVRLIGLGVKFNLTNDLEVNIFPRSSTAMKYGLLLANSVGIIDSGYKDEIKFAGCNISPFKIESGKMYTKYNEIEEGTKIAQFKVYKYIPELGGKIDITDNVEFVEVDEFTDYKNDRKGGFGSTGNN